MENTAIILAAGKGTRMKSDLPKVLHKIAGKPMLHHVLDVLDEAQVSRKIVVLGHGAEQVEEGLPSGVEVVYQREQLGTGHAVMQAKELLADINGPVLVVCGDTPLLRGDTISDLLKQHAENKNAVTVLTAVIDKPLGYGRIVREGSNITGIVEEKDANSTEKQIKEINTGTYCFAGDFLTRSLTELTTENAQGEYYLTDLISIANQKGLQVTGYVLEDIKESLGINNRIQLAEAEKILRLRVLEKLMLEGVTIIDPQATYVDSQVQIGYDTVIYPNTFLEGSTTIGSNCNIGPGSRIVDSEIGDNTQIQNSVIVESQVGSNCNIGPFAYLRPGAQLGDNIKIGDFVEIKKSTIGNGSKVPHLSYVGDAIVGENVNIGCGTITCNYDGKAKHQTVINDKAFIGSNTNLVAPVIIGEQAVIGAGSTITRNVPDKALGIARQKQKNIDHWIKE